MYASAKYLLGESIRVIILYRVVLMVCTFDLTCFKSFVAHRGTLDCVRKGFSAVLVSGFRGVLGLPRLVGKTRTGLASLGSRFVLVESNGRNFVIK